MEFIPIAIGLFFTIGWSFGVMTQKQFATVPNRNVVIWWWLGIIGIFLNDLSFWHLLWVMPATLMISTFAAIAIRGLVGLLVGGVPVFLLLIFG